MHAGTHKVHTLSTKKEGLRTEYLEIHQIHTGLFTSPANPTRRCRKEANPLSLRRSARYVDQTFIVEELSYDDQLSMA